MNEIGEELQYARESSGVSLNEASKDLGIKVEILENIEDGRTGAFKDIFELKEYISNYAKYLGLNNKDITLASFIGLLHDYARFEQWTKYKTYSDKDSIDHGDLAVKRLFEDNEIINYDLDVNDYEIVYNSQGKPYFLPDSVYLCGLFQYQFLPVCRLSRTLHN